MKILIVKVALPVPLRKLFDYQWPSEFGMLPTPCKGIRVQVPFGNRTLVGFVVEIIDQSKIPLTQLKSIAVVLDSKPLLPQTLMTLLEWISHYYHYPFGEVLSLAFPSQLRRVKSSTPVRKKLRRVSTSDVIVEHEGPIDVPTLNIEQKKAFETVQQSWNIFSVFLLEGVTGSGKTEVYLRLMESILKQNKQVLFLVPEISLTPQIVTRLQERFHQKIAVFHSGLTEKARSTSWELARQGLVNIIVGTRSVLFTPMPSLGLIILDEEHDQSFKQQTGLQYHARDVCIMRARLESIPIVLGSATPSLESLWNTKHKKHYTKLVLSQRAGHASLPTIQLLDLRRQKILSGLSETLLKIIEKHLNAGNQVLLFLNRRGFSPLYLCHICGQIVMCPNCASPLRFHYTPVKSLKCHYCSYIQAIPKQCDHCGHQELFPLGQGTQKIEQVLQELFPDIPQIRIDADSTRGKNNLKQLLEKTLSGIPAILIGTQILAKGHHFPNVTLAAILEIDGGLFRTHFRALEQTAQLIMQVAGRAGRDVQKPGEVIVQTYHPEHSFFQQLLNKGYQGFSLWELRERKQAHWPPFTYLAILHAEARHQDFSLKALAKIKEKMMSVSKHHLSILGPVLSTLVKKAGYYRAHLLFQSSQRAPLQKFLDELLLQFTSLQKEPVRWILEIDPLEVD